MTLLLLKFSILGAKIKDGIYPPDFLADVEPSSTTNWNKLFPLISERESELPCDASSIGTEISLERPSFSKPESDSEITLSLSKLIDSLVLLTADEQ